MSCESFSELGLPSQLQNFKTRVLNEQGKRWLSLNVFPLSFRVFEGRGERPNGFICAALLHQIKRTGEVCEFCRVGSEK